MLNRKFKFIAGAIVPLVLLYMPAGSHQNDASITFGDSVSVEKTASTKVSIDATAITLNKQAASFVKDYIKRNDNNLSKIKVRGELCFGMMDSIFNRFGLPVELKYLAVIESELKSTATSRVGAKGPWQFMPATAKVLGLKITRQYDERTNYRKSTRAAAMYLRDLHAMYGDWLLVLAAYNCGPGPVNYAIKKSGSRNFWKLQNYLPAESRDHVKKFIATHYYFEGQGGETTLTKAELKKLMAVR
jgi:membrane-bound lytic murein transglycosylase D